MSIGFILIHLHDNKPMYYSLFYYKIFIRDRFKRKKKNKQLQK